MACLLLSLAGVTSEAQLTVNQMLPPAPKPVDECQVIARVGNQVVLACEVLWQVNLLLEDKLDQIPPDKVEEVRAQLIEQHLMMMLDLKLLYTDFRAKVPQADIGQIHNSLMEQFDEKEVPLLIKQLKVKDKAELETRLIELGTSLAERRDDFFQRTIAQQWIRESVDIDPSVTHQQMLDYYREHAAEYDYPSQAKWEELTVQFNRFNSKAQAYRTIAEMGNQAFPQVAAANQASDGQTAEPAFSEIAKTSSQGFNASEGGVYDWTTKGALADKKIDNVLFTSPVGQMSPILETDFGFHIVRVLERKMAGRTPFTEVQTEIQQEIRNKRYSTGINSKLSELRKKARIWTTFKGNIPGEEYAAMREGPKQR